MSIAAAQASKFYEQVVRDGHVLTFLEEGAFLVYALKDHEGVPLWSSRTRVGRIQREHPKYRPYTINEINLADCLARTLPDLSAERISVGINWSGPRLVGYDESVEDLLRNLEYWKKKLHKDRDAR